MDFIVMQPSGIDIFRNKFSPPLTCAEFLKKTSTKLYRNLTARKTLFMFPLEIAPKGGRGAEEIIQFRNERSLSPSSDPLPPKEP